MDEVIGGKLLLDMHAKGSLVSSAQRQLAG